MKRIMFSIHCGDSIAHILRTRKIAQALKAKGYEILYSAPNKAKYLLNGFINPSDHFSNDQCYSFAASIDNSLWKQNFINHASVEAKIFRTFKPDILIGDTGLITHSYNRDVPILKILNRFYLELLPSSLSPFTDKEKKMVRNDTEELINRARYIDGLSENFEYYHFAKGEIILNAPYFLTHHLEGNFIHSGIYSRLKPSTNKIINKNAVMIIPGTGSSYKELIKFLTLFEVIGKHFDEIYISTNGIDINKLSKSYCNIKAQKQYDKIPDNVGLVICHGGYGSLYSAVCSNVAIICIPNQIEQFSNSWHIEQLGYGKNIGYYDKNEFKGLYQKISFDSEKLLKAFVEIESQKYKEAYIPDESDRFSLVRNVISWVEKQ